MKTEIIERIKALGGRIPNDRDISSILDLQNISFNACLYPKPKDTPWATAKEQEPIIDIGIFIDENRSLYNNDKNAFFEKMIDHYFPTDIINDSPCEQTFWECTLFTPFLEGSTDYGEIDGSQTESQVKELVKGDKMEFLLIAYSYSYPDNYFICLSDPNPQNPTVYGTDHEQYFVEISEKGTLEEFLNTYMTQEELLHIVKRRMT